MSGHPNASARNSDSARASGRAQATGVLEQNKLGKMGERRPCKVRLQGRLGEGARLDGQSPMCKALLGRWR